MNARLNDMIVHNVIPCARGIWIDCYNKCIDTECAGTILCGIDFRHIHFITDMENEKIIIPANTADGQTEMEIGGVCDLSYPSSKTRRGRVQDGGAVTPTLTTHTENCLRRIESGMRIRKLTERECFRLMGVSDADIDKIQAAGISKSQQYKLAGNSIVVNCLASIFRHLLIGNFNDNQQTELF